MESEKPNNSKTAAPQEANRVRLSQGTSGNQNKTSVLIHGGTEGPHSDGSRNLSKLLFRFGEYVALALLIIKLLWATPANEVSSQAHACGAGSLPGCTP
jgi:hypothetical protein